MDRIIDYSDTATTNTRMLSLKIGTKRADHTLPHSQKKKRRIKWNVDKLMSTVDGRKQILCQVSGTGGKCASMSSQQKQSLTLITRKRQQKVFEVMHTVAKIDSIVSHNDCLAVGHRRQHCMDVNDQLSRRLELHRISSESSSLVPLLLPFHNPGVRRSQLYVKNGNHKNVSCSGKYGAAIESVTGMKVLLHKRKEDISALAQIWGRDENTRSSAVDENERCIFCGFCLLIQDNRGRFRQCEVPRPSRDRTGPPALCDICSPLRSHWSTSAHPIRALPTSNEINATTT